MGVKKAFTSLHIPEDKGDLAAEAKSLLEAARQEGIQVYADVSAETPSRLNLNSMNDLPSLGITGLRLDDGFSLEEMAGLSRMFSIAVNASTVFEKDLKELLSAGIEPEKIIAWHNFYPRRETGLDDVFFANQNRVFALYGIQTAAFIPGTGRKRGPLREGLPTLEKHRNGNPLHSAVELETLGTDNIFIGDPDFTGELLADLVTYSKEKTIKLKARCDHSAEGFYRVRPDLSRDVIRLLDTRSKNPVLPLASKERRKGSITMDNDLYGRYRGEIQIVKRDLPEDKRVNVVGTIEMDDMRVLDLIQSDHSLLIERIRDE